MTRISSYGIGLASILGIGLLLGLSSPPLSRQLPFDGIDLKTPKKIPGKRLDIERFAGTLVIKTVDQYADHLTLTATGNDEELKKLKVVTDQEGEINVNQDGEIANENPTSITMTITMPKSMPLELHLNYGKATLADHTGSVSLFIEGTGTIATGILGSDLESSITGSGEITINGIDSTTRTTSLHPLNMTIQGDGKITINAFNHENIKAAITGEGLIKLNGIVHDGNFTINGTGRIEAAKVTGKLSHYINGSGAIVVASK